MLATANGGTVIGVDAVVVRVEVDLCPGMMKWHLVGLPDGAVREAKIRVRSAMSNSGFDWPRRRIHINLAPADLRKDGSSFDLPIALALLAASDGLSGEATERLETLLAAGELSLDGELRPVRGVLPLAIGARDAGLEAILVAPENAAEASLVAELDVVPCRTLADAVEFVRTGCPARPIRRTTPDELMDSVPRHIADMADVCGQENAKRALEVAAAGGHNVLLVGPPGSGKTMLSKRITTILPQMTFDEALETTKVYSVSGLTQGDGIIAQRPFRAPHHTISDVGLIGGGSGIPRPGEISLAHNGVLFLDELPEFRKHVLEVLRQPLEDGAVTISRSLVSVDYPARLMLIGSMNPCPCGYLGDPTHACTCTPYQVTGYRNRLSGPLIDRIDLHVEVPAVRYRELKQAGEGEASASVRARVEAARVRQRERFAGREIHCNAQMTAADLREFCSVDAEGHRLLERVVDKLGMSARAYDRILKVARTIADLAEDDAIRSPHVAEAVRYRALDRPAEM